MKTVLRNLLCLLLPAAAGCARTMPQPNGSELYDYETWTVAAVVGFGLVLVISGIRSMRTLARVLLVFAGGSILVMMPSYFNRSIDIHGAEIHFTHGGWWNIRHTRVQMDDVNAIRIVTERGGDTLKNLTERRYLIFTMKDRSERKLPYDQIARLARPKIEELAMQRSILFEDE